MRLRYLTAAILGLMIGSWAQLGISGELGSPPSALQDYVSRPESDFEWKLVRTTEIEGTRFHQLHVTSQKWQSFVWQHAVEIYEPRNMRYPSHALLFVTGGSKPGPPDKGDMEFGLRLAALCGSRVVMLHQVPNQPIFDRTEDDLITETWLRYLDTGDATWPLLFPMVKSAVKTMDAVQDFINARSPTPVEQFLITGASKRGWTSWLTPVVDDRVCGTAPIVIDMLNFRPQMNHQLACWGKFSDQIIDYTSKGLVKQPHESESPREEELRHMMDPYTYRRQLQLPKLLIVGTNDPYWTCDAMNLYWNGLEGPKYIRQVPNAGHGLEGGRESAMTSLAVFFRHVAGGRAMPEPTWTFENGDRRMKLTMSADQRPNAIRFWSARSTDNDFRDDHWTATELSNNGIKSMGMVEVPDGRHAAVFGEYEFDLNGLKWSLTTQVFRQ